MPPDVSTNMVSSALGILFLLLLLLGVVAVAERWSGGGARRGTKEDWPTTAFWERGTKAVGVVYADANCGEDDDDDDDNAKSTASAALVNFIVAYVFI